MADDGRDARGGRDDGVADRLRVPPLDEVTRRRLVGTAMRATDPGRSRRARRSALVGAAAAAAVVLTGGLTFLAVQGDDTAPVAGRPPPGELSRRSPGAGAPEDQRASAESGLPRAATTPGPAPVALGDLGDLRGGAARDRLRAAVEAVRSGQATDANAFSGSDATEYDAAGGSPTRLVQQLADAGCAGALPDGALVAVGTGRLGSRPAIVAVVARTGGEPAAYAVLPGTCEVRALL